MSSSSSWMGDRVRELMEMLSTYGVHLPPSVCLDVLHDEINAIATRDGLSPEVVRSTISGSVLDELAESAARASRAR